MSRVHQHLQGEPAPLGANWLGEGTNFAIYAEHAVRVELCIFDDEPPHQEIHRFRLLDHHGPVWHGYVQGIHPGTRYGYRVDGPYRPDLGMRYNPAKLLMDPYARAISGEVDWDAPVYGYQRGGDLTDDRIDGQDDAAGVPHGIVIDHSFDWEDDVPLRTPWSETVIYEAHVKGMTKLHPHVPESVRGTYRGLSHPAIIDHFTRLGVTAIELLPVHAFIDDDFLVRAGLRNYWGYNTLGFFAPEGRYSAAGDRGAQVREFKELVKSFHAAGIEVILDVVYNHTAEGGHLGPTLSMRGIDNLAYYRLSRGRPRYYEDTTGTGNTVDVSHPQTLKLVMDSLRYWVLDMHVDGFRFDLAPSLGREEHEFSPAAVFFRAVHQDPVLSNAKLIAEPWDLGGGGYQLGSFPPGWNEWNDRFRDTVRRYWRGDRGMLGELGFRLTGSADLFEQDGRGPFAGINFVTAHDGFTLRDLVSYAEKHNDANGELNRDGFDHNASENYGVEGTTNDPEINALRHRQMRNMIATTILSQGVPMILGGDERGRTQSGNNNAYCQDNEISWLDWRDSLESNSMEEFVRRALEVRRSFAAFRQERFCSGARIDRLGARDVTWYAVDGKQMTLDDWTDSHRRAIAFRLIPSKASLRGIKGDLSPVFLAFNADTYNHRFKLPNGTKHMAGEWVCILSTDDTHRFDRVFRPATSFVLQQRSMIVFRHHAGG